MSRDALIIGINAYHWNGLQSLSAPANDAESIAQRLEQYGDFRVRRLPEFLDPFDNDARRLAQNANVSLEQLEEALVHLFKPTGKHASETALLFFSGHGLRKDRGIQEGYLATSDVNPTLGNWGLSLQWLRRLLQESSVRQQIIWLDCCYSGELLNFDEADPGDLGRGRDRCFISASREYEVAFEETGGQHSLLTGVLLDGLDPNGRADGLVTNFTLTNFIQQSSTLRVAPQQPLFANSGSKIMLLGRSVESPQAVLSGICPYKGLAYFDCNDEDPKYFYGRTALTDALLEKVREGNFLAVLGASGSGKSSVIRAGLLYQLKLGQRLSGSNEWTIHIVRPGEHPLQNLALAFLDPHQSAIDRATQLARIEDLLSRGAVGLAQLAKATKHRLVLVIDQFEEVFTVCRDLVKLQQFFECLLGATEQAGQKFCVILGMRADFFSKCLEQEYAGLASKIQSSLVTVGPMSREELKQAVIEPAKQVGLEVEQELANQILIDVESSPGSLPLLQYTLTELWKQRAVNWLTLSSYHHLGGVQGTLQKRATAVYEQFPETHKPVVKYIFLSLTQLGEGTEDTRRRALKQDLVNRKYSESLLDEVVQKLADEKLIVTNEIIGKDQLFRRTTIVDVIHEALIRHWSLLKQWLEESRDSLRQKRKIESAAEEWRGQGKNKDYLFRGRLLVEAKRFNEEEYNLFPLSNFAVSFVQEGLKQQCLNQIKFVGFLMIPVAILVLIIEAALREEAIRANYIRLSSSNSLEQRIAILPLVKGCSASDLTWLPKYLSERLFGNCRSLENINLEKVNLINADLRNANFQGADLRNANFQEANLSGANLQGTDLGGANLNSANLQAAKLMGTDLRNANLIYSNLERANLQSALLLRTNLRYASLKNANLSSANLERANLLNANLRGANLSNAILKKAYYNLETELSESIRSSHQIYLLEPNSNLERADLSKAGLTNLDLKGVNFSNAVLEGADLRNTNLSEAILRNANLSKANLRDANLKGAILQNTILDKVMLCKTMMIDGNLKNRDCNI